MKKLPSGTFLLIVLLPLCAFAGVRRALLVGINQYIPPTDAPMLAQGGRNRGQFSDLAGCVNDVTAMREMLVARYQFQSNNIHVITNSAASRDGILRAMRKDLIDDAAAGDVCFFFYAGHGSLIRNLKSNKPSGMDSTIVPSDACQGAMDIRDKELARLFKKALDKGVVLTAIFDSCHSGSIGRGLPKDAVARDIIADSRVVSDPPDPGPPPEDLGALILSAAQDYQSAHEITDDKSVSRGAFTLALLKAMSATPVNAPADQLFIKAQTLLGSENPDQIPVLAGVTRRRQSPLFGSGDLNSSNQMILAVKNVDFNLGLVELGGGEALGLSEGCELRRVSAFGEGDANRGPELKLVSIDGLDKCKAAVTVGRLENIQVGDFFQVARWVFPNNSRLRIWVPPSPFTPSKLAKLAPEFAALQHSGRIQWVLDPTEITPTHVLSWSGSAWNLTGTGDIGSKLTAANVLDHLSNQSHEKPKLFVNLPPPVTLSGAISNAAVSDNCPVQFVASNLAASYWLAGRWDNSQIEYGWIRPNASQDNSSLNPLPVRTDWQLLPTEASSVITLAKTLEEEVRQTCRLKAWLTLESPGSSSEFPYHLVLRNTSTGQSMVHGDQVTNGTPCGLVLEANPDANLNNVAPHWIYVLITDSWGKTQLIFPPSSQGNVGNRVPYSSGDGSTNAVPKEIVLGDPNDPTLLTIARPFGLDTYVMLICRDPLQDPSQLESEGVRTKGKNANSNPLAEYLAGVGSTSRGPSDPVPTDWEVQKICIRSMP